MDRFKSKNVLITGAASGIGKAAAFRIAAEGGNLALVDIDFNKLEGVALELKDRYKVKVAYARCQIRMQTKSKTVLTLSSKRLEGFML